MLYLKVTKLNKYKSLVSYINESGQAGLPSIIGSHGPIVNFCSPRDDSILGQCVCVCV